MAERVSLTGAEVIAIYHRQGEEYGGSHGLPDPDALESAAFRPQTGYYGELSEEAAALLESLVHNHPFVDGNKPVGFAAARTVLPVNGFDLDVCEQGCRRFHDQNDRGRQVSLCAASQLDGGASCASSGIDFRAGAPAPHLRFRPFWEDFHR
jgi:death on curing protein